VLENERDLLGLLAAHRIGCFERDAAGISRRIDLSWSYRRGAAILTDPEARKGLLIERAALYEHWPPPSPRERSPQTPRGPGGRPSKQEIVIAWIDEHTPHGEEPMPKVKRAAIEKFGIADRTLRKYLKHRRERHK
jgi:hypothetical protein